MDPTQFQPGYRLDRYELLCPLAYGGMAAVWLARFAGRLGFERMVVIKMILPQYSQDPRFQQMFLDEVRIASMIEHGNVARILDVGEHQENYFIVMDWIDGDSLSKIMRAAEQNKQRIPIGIALRICADAAAGLHAAHELHERDGVRLGVVHRDVSPQNILVANNGTTVVIDFGVAKARDRVSQDTGAGQLKGKIRYMAPEQALGRSIDHRADVWALGALLYEMFVGHPPYDGPNEVATLHKLTSGQRPAALPASTPASLRSVIDRSLAYDPDHRFGSALEFNLAVEATMLDVGEPTTPPVVAQYTSQLLADRKAARRHAVDAAVNAARRRDMPSSSVGMPTHPQWTPSGGVPFAAPSQRSGEFQAASLDAHGRLDPREIPSVASNGTIAAAAIEAYPQSNGANPRLRRYVVSAIIGMSAASGLIGIVLIGAALVRRGEAKNRLPAAGDSTGVMAQPSATTTSATAAATAPTPVEATPPPSATAPPEPTTTTEPPPPAMEIPEAPSAMPPAPVPTPAAATAPSPNPVAATTTAPATRADPAPRPTVVHKPAPLPIPKPKPAPTKPDRGF